MPAIDVGHGLGGHNVVTTLERSVSSGDWRSAPTRQRHQIREGRHGSVGVHQRRAPGFQPDGRLTDNALIEPFNGRFREDCLNVHWFPSLEDAQQRSTPFGGTSVSITLTEV